MGTAEAKIEKPAMFSKLPAFAQLEDALWAIVKATLSRDPVKRPDADELVELCSELCYATPSRLVGRITSFGEGTGDWGFIDADGETVMLHRSEFYGVGLKVGMKVNFAPHTGRPRRRAAPAIPLRLAAAASTTSAAR